MKKILLINQNIEDVEEFFILNSKKKQVKIKKTLDII